MGGGGCVVCGGVLFYFFLSAGGAGARPSPGRFLVTFCRLELSSQVQQKGEIIENLKGGLKA